MLYCRNGVACVFRSLAFVPLCDWSSMYGWWVGQSTNRVNVLQSAAWHAWQRTSQVGSKPPLPSLLLSTFPFRVHASTSCFFCVCNPPLENSVHHQGGGLFQMEWPRPHILYSTPLHKSQSHAHQNVVSFEPSNWDKKYRATMAPACGGSAMLRAAIASLQAGRRKSENLASPFIPL